MDPNRVIGKDNDLPWPRIKEDMKFFRETTKGHVIIMGRKTYDSIGKPLPKRTNYVVSRNPKLEIEGCEVFSSVSDAIKAALEIDESPMIIGGSSIYKEALPFTGVMYISQVKENYPGDTYFPTVDETEWKANVISETDKVLFTKWLRRTGL